MTLYCCQRDTQRKLTGHRQGPHRSPGSRGGSTTAIKWEEPRDCTWPSISLQMPVRQNASLFTSCCGEHEAQTLQSFASLGTRRPWPQTRRLCLSHALWVFFQPTTGHLRSRTECVFNSSFHSDQLMENRLRRPPRISSDLQVKEAGSAVPPWSPGQAWTLEPARVRLPPAWTQGCSQDSPIVFLMESNPRGLYIFPLILGILFLFLRT